MFRPPARSDLSPLDEVTAERLLDGASVDEVPDSCRDVAELLAIVTRPPSAYELDGTAAAAASFVTAHHAANRPVRRTRPVVALAVTAVLFVASTGTAVAATVGALPQPMQAVAHEALGVVGISVPGIEPKRPDPTVVAESGNDSDSATATADAAGSGSGSGAATATSVGGGGTGTGSGSTAEPGAPSQAGSRTKYASVGSPVVGIDPAESPDIVIDPVPTDGDTSTDPETPDAPEVPASDPPADDSGPGGPKGDKPDAKPDAKPAPDPKPAPEQKAPPEPKAPKDPKEPKDPKGSK